MSADTSKRLGYFTGRVYDDNTALECCAILNERTARSVALQNRLFEQIHKNCKGCYGCPESVKEE